MTATTTTSGSVGPSSPPMSLVAMLMISVVATAVANTIARRVALASMRGYPYFLTQVQNLAYVVFYGGTLCARYRRRDGTATAEMLRIPKRPFLWIGFWDGLGGVLGNVGLIGLPGYEGPLLDKLNIVFVAIFSSLILGNSYSRSQTCAMAIVICGCVVTLTPLILQEASSSSSKSPSELLSTIAYTASVASTALSFVLKEEVFQKHRRLNLDIFVVNTYSSIVALAFTVVLMPLAAVLGLGGVSPTEFPTYMRQGAECFRGYDPTDEDDCTGAPLAPLIYIGINLMFNVSFLALVKCGGALLTFLTNAMTFPLATILFVLPWPLLGSTTLNVFGILGLAVELVGIVFYQRVSPQDFGGESDKGVELSKYSGVGDDGSLNCGSLTNPVSSAHPRGKEAFLGANGAHVSDFGSSLHCSSSV